MKLSFIVTSCYAAASVAAYASLERPIPGSRELSKRNDRQNTDLKTPLLGTSSPKRKAPEPPEPPVAEAKVTTHAGPHTHSTISRSNGRYNSKWTDVRSGKPGSLTASHPDFTKVRAWPGSGGKSETETTAKRVKVKMDIWPPALATVSRKRKDGEWSEEVVSGGGKKRKYFKNDDGSPVEVKASLFGDGRLSMTGDQSAKPMKRGRQYEPNE